MGEYTKSPESEPILDQSEINARFSKAVAKANRGKNLIGPNTNSVDFQTNLISQADHLIRELVRENPEITDDELVIGVKELAKFKSMTESSEPKQSIKIPDDAIKEFAHHTRKYT